MALKDVRKQQLESLIKTAKNTIEMLKRTIGECVLKRNYSAISELVELINENQKKINYLNDANKNNFEVKEYDFEKGLSKLEDVGSFSSENQHFVCRCKKNDSSTKNDEDKKDEIITSIVGQDIYELINEHGFLIGFPEKLSISETDVIKYKILADVLEITIKNNIKCPIFAFEDVVEHNSVLNEKIIIYTLDNRGTVLYSTVYYVDKLLDYETSGGDYTSREPQTITLHFHFTKKKSYRLSEEMN